MLNKKLLGGTASAPAVYVDDVFSTYLYTGTGATQTITNNIDLAGKGGLTWIKRRGSGTGSHQLFDTVRGVNKYLRTNGTDAQDANGAFTDLLTSFNSNGFTLGADASAQQVNSVGTGDTYCSWSFREQAKFFDVVTGTGGGTFNHSLGVTPGMIMIKLTSGTSDWWTVHRSSNGYFRLNLTNAAASTGTPGIASTGAWVNASSTTFSTSQFVSSGESFVAYLFAHDAGGFGTSGADNVISCGSFTTDGSGNATVSLGYEPQYVMWKASSATGNWFVEDSMRAFNLTSRAILFPNLSNAEATGTSAYLSPNATGFSAVNNQLDASTTYIYMAIRRPMKVPTSGTEVFSTDITASASTSSTPTYSSGFVTDMGIEALRTGSSFNFQTGDRLRGAVNLYTNRTDAEASNSNIKFDYMNGWGGWSSRSSDYMSWMFKRASGFFDVVCYTGTGSARTVTHNLGVAPELYILKCRNSTEATNWVVAGTSLSSSTADYLYLNTAGSVNTTASIWQAPTSTTIGIGTAFPNDKNLNQSGLNYVVYLFASVAGVSKVGSYTGNGSSQTINCGFTAGARFVMIKRTDSTGDWVVLDTARGIVSGNDPFLQFNSTAAEVTGEDIVDPANSGFIVNETTEAINTNAATYIYLAIA